MPNGGTHHCGLYCCHFDNKQETCRLRKIQIEHPFLTTCNNFNRPGRAIVGPLYAIVCEVKSGAGGYTSIPYFDGRRVDTVQPRGGGDTVVCFADRNGEQHEFSSSSDYLQYRYLATSCSIMSNFPLDGSFRRQVPLAEDLTGRRESRRGFSWAA